MQAESRKELKPIPPTNLPSGILDRNNQLFRKLLL